MKLVVIIPCLNEEKTLPGVLKTIPKKIKGINKIETLIIDDGSTDNTIEAAKKYGVKRFVIHRSNLGLARSFSDGLDEALRLGADIIVNTDGDNQYPQEDIPRLIKPIMDGKADIVVANRQTHKIKHFPLYKKILQKIGSKVVKYFSGVNVPDAVSGFRAYSREVAMRINVFTDYTYTIETIIQAGKMRKRIEVIKIKTKPKSRESRLIKSLWGYLKSSAATIIRVFAIYEPLKVFSYIAFFIFTPGIVLIGRFTYLYITDDQGSHLQSLIVGSILILISFQVGLLGLLADIMSVNRRLNENILYKLKNIQYEKDLTLKTKKNGIKKNRNDTKNLVLRTSFSTLEEQTHVL